MVRRNGFLQLSLAGAIGIAVMAALSGCGSGSMPDDPAGQYSSPQAGATAVTMASENASSSDGSDDNVDSVSSTTPAPTPTDGSGGPTPAILAPLVDPDPNFEDALDDARISSNFWPETDFSRYTVPLDEFRSGGVFPDQIPPIDSPKFLPLGQADSRLHGEEPVMAFELNGDARAYPLQILIFHEIVNDVVGGVPVVITYCPLCNSAIAFERTLEGVVLDFGTTGNLRNSDLVMYDRQTRSWWQQFTGEGVVGALAGRQLTFLPASIISWQDFQDAFPDGEVLSSDTGNPRPYGTNPYLEYDRAYNDPFLFDGEIDGRLGAKDRVVAVTLEDVAVAFPFLILEEERTVSYRVGSREIVVFFQDGTQSALDADLFGFSRDVGATGVFDPLLDGRMLTFRSEDERIVDDQTGSIWNILGHAVDGELAGEVLAPVVHANHFWFAWAAFNPDTLIYEGVG